MAKIKEPKPLLNEKETLLLRADIAAQVASGVIVAEMSRRSLNTNDIAVISGSIAPAVVRIADSIVAELNKQSANVGP